MQENYKPVIKMGPTLQQNSCMHTVRGTTGERRADREMEVSVGGLPMLANPAVDFFLLGDPASAV